MEEAALPTTFTRGRPRKTYSKKEAAKAIPKKAVSEEVDEADPDDKEGDVYKFTPRKRNTKRKASDPGEGSSATNVSHKRISLGRTAKSKRWDAPHVLTHTKSPLGKTRERNDLMVCPP